MVLKKALRKVASFNLDKLSAMLEALVMVQKELQGNSLLTFTMAFTKIMEEQNGPTILTLLYVYGNARNDHVKSKRGTNSVSPSFFFYCFFDTLTALRILAARPPQIITIPTIIMKIALPPILTYLLVLFLLDLCIPFLQAE